MLTSYLGFAKFWQGNFLRGDFFNANIFLSLTAVAVCLTAWWIFLLVFLKRAANSTSTLVSHFKGIISFAVFQRNLTWPALSFSLEAQLHFMTRNMYRKYFQFQTVQMAMHWVSSLKTPLWKQVVTGSVIRKTSCLCEGPKLGTTFQMPGECGGTQDSCKQGTKPTQPQQAQCFLYG